MISFNDFIHKNNLKNKAISNIKISEVLKKVGLDSEVGNYLKDGNFSTNYGVFNLHPSKRTHWVCHIKDCDFDSCGFSTLKKILDYIKNKHGKCIYFEYQVQKNDKLCGSYVL